jgi:hypothetical protein
MINQEERLEKVIKELYQFRARIPANLTVEKVKETWGINIDQRAIPKVIQPRGNIIEEKIEILKNSLDLIIKKQFVRFVGISGSVASEFAKTEDDIDLFIVTKNDRVWIYRLLVYINNLFSKRIRSKGDSNVKNKLCLNFLVEERAVNFDPDIFNLNELIYIKPIYNKKFLRVIFLSNPWLKDRYLLSDKFLGMDDLKVGDVKRIGKRNYFLSPLNFIAFVLQLLFMLVTNHNPDINRLLRGFKEGRVEFYPKDFKEEKIKGVKAHSD